MDDIKETILNAQSKSTSQAYNRVKLTYDEMRQNDPHCEQSVIKWLTYQATLKNPTTLWSETSHLIKYLHYEHNVQINRTIINSYLKVKQSTHLKKKAPAFSQSEIFNFL